MISTRSWTPTRSWAKLNRHYWRRDWTGFTEFFFGQMFPEPHSSKQLEDCVDWAAGTTVEAMLNEMDAKVSADHGAADSLPTGQLSRPGHHGIRGPLSAARARTHRRRPDRR